MTNKYTFLGSIVLSAVFLLAWPVQAAGPGPGVDNWFQLLASPFTGSDNTGDGGTGLPADYNYYYVGQIFTTTMEVKSVNTTAANIWIDYNTTRATAGSLTTGSYFPSWSNQTIAAGRVKSTGYRVAGISSGTGNFGTVQWTMKEPTMANYGTGAAETLLINTGVWGATTESNISYLGNDLLDAKEDFRYHIWADTKKPYALNPGPVDTALNVAVESNYVFDLRDSKNGEGDNSGVGTGVNTAEPPGALTFNALSYTAFDAFACSGIWGTNLCTVTVNPPSPLAIPGDTRNWNYSTLYTFNVSGFRDLASATQDQLGDINGPNTMLPKTWTFTTEADTVAPRVVAETPVRNSIGQSIATNISIDVHDKKTYPGTVSGVGVASSTCRFDVWSDSVATTTYQTVTAGMTVTSIPFGYNFTINPAADFLQNEWVYVIARNCQDLVGNTMINDQWRFKTVDTDPPFVDTRAPGNDQGISASGTIAFHVKDLGVGVDLANLVVYVNGIYYKNVAGGAGQVTVNGTRITYASTTAFTSVSGTPDDYAIVITPVNPFLPGESVPVEIFARDVSNNIMERDIYAMAVGGGTGQICGNAILEGNEVCDDSNTVSGDGCSANCLSNETCGNSLRELVEQCDDGNAVSGDGCSAACLFESVISAAACGAGTSWNGSVCVASCSSGGGGGNGGGAAIPLFITTVQLYQINEQSVLITWLTNVPATSRVVFGSNSVASLGAEPNYGYPYSTMEFVDKATYHSVIVNNLQAGTVYNFRAASKANGAEVVGPEVVMTPMFCTAASVKPIQSLQCPNVPVVEKPVVKPPTKIINIKNKPVTVPISTPSVAPVTHLKITNVLQNNQSLNVKGTFKPSTKLKVIIY